MNIISQEIIQGCCSSYKPRDNVKASAGEGKKKVQHVGGSKHAHIAPPCDEVIKTKHKPIFTFNGSVLAVQTHTFGITLARRDAII